MSQFESERVPGKGPTRDRRAETSKNTQGELSPELTPPVRLRGFDSIEPSPALVNTGPEEAALLDSGRYPYHLLGEIARGGVGVVLKAHDTRLGRDIAIKVLGRRHAHEPGVRRRFVEEAQIGGQLQHPGVLPVYELGELDDQRPFIAMKLVRGRTLSTLFAERGSLQDDRRRLLTIFESVCQAVAYAHSKGVVHRDLKPDNVMVGAFGEVQVGDWGLAKVLDRGSALTQPGDPAEAEARRTSSLPGTILGTPRYMPPEQANGQVEQTDERSDVFSLGAILCELLTGAPPYGNGGGHPALVQAAMGNLEEPFGRIEACDADGELKTLARDCLAPLAQDRPQDAGQIAARIQEYLAAADERVHAAELVAAETQGKLAAATRQRQLTIGLATTIVLALLSTTAFLRARILNKLEQTAELQTVLDQNHERTLALRGNGRIEEALELAQSTVTAVETSRWAGDDQRNRAARLMAETEVFASEAREQVELERRNAELIAKLDLLSYDRIRFRSVPRPASEFGARYAAAFEAFGAPLDFEDPDPFYEAFRWDGLEVDIASALDTWAGLLRAEEGWASHRSRILTLLAIDLDKDAGRNEVRSAIIENDLDQLIEYAAHAVDRGSSAAMQFTLLQAVLEHPRYSTHSGPNSLDITKLSSGLYPDDFLMNCLGGFYAFERDRRPDKAIPLMRTAVAQRPTDGRVRLTLGASLALVGNLPEAVAMLDSARAVSRELTMLEAEAGDALWRLGRFEAAAAAFERAVHESPQVPTIKTDLAAVRYLAGAITRADLIATIEAREDPTQDELIAFAEGLLFHPEATLEDKERALAACRRIRARTGETGLNMAPVMCKAMIDLDLVPELVKELDNWELSLRFQSLCYVAIRSSFRARALHRLGEPEFAKLELKRARRNRDFLIGKDAEAWKHSRLVRLVQEAETELGR